MYWQTLKSVCEGGLVNNVDDSRITKGVYWGAMTEAIGSDRNEAKELCL